MCQRNSEIPHEAEEDIVCYKVLRWTHLEDANFSEDYFRAPYQTTSYEIGKTYHDYVRPQIQYGENGNIRIDGGFYHFIKDFEAAREFMLYFAGQSFVGQYAVVKCVIPKGALMSRGTFTVGSYYADKDRFSCDSICARSFTFVEVAEFGTVFEASKEKV